MKPNPRKIITASAIEGLDIFVEQAFSIPSRCHWKWHKNSIFDASGGLLEVRGTMSGKATHNAQLSAQRTRLLAANAESVLGWNKNEKRRSTAKRLSLKVTPAYVGQKRVQVATSDLRATNC